MSHPVGASDDPAVLQAEIARTRASLDRKISELEYRLNPKVKIAQLKTQLDPRPYTGWIAAGAVAAGLWMMVAGLRRYRFSRRGGMDDPDVADMMGE